MHEIRYIEFSTRKSEKTIQKECDAISRECGEYHDNLLYPIRFTDCVLKNYDEAYEWINNHDKRWYDALAVKYKDGRATKWLVKIEYHV